MVNVFKQIVFFKLFWILLALTYFLIYLTWDGNKITITNDFNEEYNIITYEKLLSFKSEDDYLKYVYDKGNAFVMDEETEEWLDSVVNNIKFPISLYNINELTFEERALFLEDYNLFYSEGFNEYVKGTEYYNDIEYIGDFSFEELQDMTEKEYDNVILHFSKSNEAINTSVGADFYIFKEDSIGFKLFEERYNEYYGDHYSNIKREIKVKTVMTREEYDEYVNSQEERISAVDARRMNFSYLVLAAFSISLFILLYNYLIYRNSERALYYTSQISAAKYYVNKVFFPKLILMFFSSLFIFLLFYINLSVFTDAGYNVGFQDYILYYILIYILGLFTVVNLVICVFYLFENVIIPILLSLALSFFATSNSLYYPSPVFESSVFSSKNDFLTNFLPQSVIIMILCVVLTFIVIKLIKNRIFIK